MKHLCLLIQDDPLIAYGELKGFEPPVTADTLVWKAPHETPSATIIRGVSDFGARYLRSGTGALVIITHGLVMGSWKDVESWVADDPCGGAFYFGAEKFLSLPTVPLLASWRPYFSDLYIIGCGVAASTLRHPVERGFDGNGPAFCQALADLLDLTVHASRTPMRLTRPPSRGANVSAWGKWLQDHGSYARFSAR